MWLAAIRDVAIALLAIESLVIGVLLALMLLQLRKLVRLLRDEIAPILDTAGETVDTVNRTAGFVSHNVINPLVKVSSYSAGTIEAVRNILHIRRKVSGNGSNGRAVRRRAGTTREGESD